MLIFKSSFGTYDKKSPNKDSVPEATGTLRCCFHYSYLNLHFQQQAVLLDYSL